MSLCRRSIPKCSGTSAAGFTALELLIGVLIMGVAIAGTSSMFVAGKFHVQMQQRSLETTEVARAAIDMVVRDLRLGGACLPVTGDFISLEGVDNGQTDEITTRTGLTRPDLSCVRSAIPTGSTAIANAATIPVISSDGFATGMRAYIRHPDGEGEYFDVTSVPSLTTLGKTLTLTRDYPETSGIYAIDERRFFLDTLSTPHGSEPELVLQVGDKPPQSFALGIEKMDIQYLLQRNCPPCDVVNLPGSNAEWSVVDAVILNLTARSDLPDRQGNYYRRSVTVNVKPRNLLPN